MKTNQACLHRSVANVDACPETLVGVEEVCTIVAAVAVHRNRPYHRSLYLTIQFQTCNQWDFLYPSPFVIQNIFFLS